MAKVYKIVLIIIILAQAVYTYFSSNQIRLEEIIESTRSVYWFENHLVWNGGYSNIGWYALLAFVYNIFGFSFYEVKFIKLIIVAISYFCLAAVLKKYLGQKAAFLPLLTIGLSPTLIYFNSLQMSHGIDISFFLICLYLVTILNFKNSAPSLITQLLFWSLIMFAWLSYPGFVFYIPLLIGAYFYKIASFKKKINLTFVRNYFIPSILAFLFPLVTLFLYISNRELLIFDPLLKRGLFRSFGSFELNRDVFFDNVQRISSDLFIKPASYYFEVPKVEFSDFYPIVTILFVFAVSLWLIYKNYKYKKLLIVLLSLFLTYLVLVSFLGPKTLNGIRRGTVLVIIFYGLYLIVSNYIWSTKVIKKKLKYLYSLPLILLLVHHILVYPQNLKAIKEPSLFQEKWWFNQNKPADKILDDLVRQVQKTDIVLPCFENTRNEDFCSGLSLIYPAIALSCKHNNLLCHRVLTHDPQKGLVELTENYWGQKPHTEP